MIQRPKPISSPIRSRTSWGIGVFGSSQCLERSDSTAASSVPLMICGFMRSVSSSMSVRMTSVAAARSSSFGSRSHSGMYVSGSGMSQ